MEPVRTVADLIEQLKTLPPDTIPFTTVPPFTGVRLYFSEGGSKVLIASADKYEGKAQMPSRVSNSV